MSIGIGARDIGYQSEFYDCDFFIFLLDFPGSSGNGILTQRPAHVSRSPFRAPRHIIEMSDISIYRISEQILTLSVSSI